jgi:sugar/nucleoside kinase (ribokinase family)
MFDVITIGSATQDIFIEGDQGKIVNIRDAQSEESLLCFEYGTKIEIEKLGFEIGGGSINTAVNFANLGFKVAPIVKVGQDLNAKAVLERLTEKNVNDSLVINSDQYKTGLSVILTSFEGDRTVLTHRGANNHITLDEIPWNKIKNSKWLYIAPLSGDSNLVLDKIADFAEENNVSMAFNPGTTQIKRGVEDLQKILSTAEVLIMNRSEASHITKIKENYTNDRDPWTSQVYKMLIELKSYKPKVVVITDGNKGAVAFDGKAFYHAPPYPTEVVSTLGAGDAFSSTFVAGLTQFSWNIEKALIFASINAASIVTSFGAQSGLKTFSEIELIHQQNKEYKIIIKEFDEELKSKWL